MDGFCGTTSKKAQNHHGRGYCCQLFTNHSKDELGKNQVKEIRVVVTILIVAVSLASYAVGSLTGSVEIEKELPDHY